MSADLNRYRAPVAVGLTIALIAILVLVLTGTFDRSTGQRHAGHRPACPTHHPRCRGRLSR